MGKPAVGLGGFAFKVRHKRSQKALLVQAARGEASVAKPYCGASKVDQFHPFRFTLQGADRGCNPQTLTGLGIKALYQIPRCIQRCLIIHQPYPKGGQRVDMGLIATIRPAHFDELLHPRFGEDGGHMISPVR